MLNATSHYCIHSTYANVSCYLEVSLCKKKKKSEREATKLQLPFVNKIKSQGFCSEIQTSELDSKAVGELKRKIKLLGVICCLVVLGCSCLGF